MKRTIFPFDFAPYYPAGVQPCPMYVDVANRIYERIKDVGLELPNADELKKDIAVNVAIYYEDKMSGIGLWNSFRRLHRAEYSRDLPFFDNFDDLDWDDVNLAEVQFLVWLVISRNFDDRFLNPLAMGEEAAAVIMEILTEDDDVEENDDLYDYIYNKDNAKDYFKLKHVLLWLRRSYLLCSPVSESRFYELYDAYKDKFKKESEAAYYAETSFSMTTEVGPMALMPHLWLAKMYAHNEMKDEAERLNSLRYVQQDIFSVTKATYDFAILKDSKGEERKMKNVSPDVFKTGSYVCTSLVKYGDCDWEINGVIFNSHKDVYEKISERKRELEHSCDHVYPLYMKRTKGKRMAFFEDKSELMAWLSEISPKISIDEVNQHLPNGLQVAFISKKVGLIFAPNVVHAIKCDDNPFYGKCDARTLREEVMTAILNPEFMHAELLHYLLENKMLQDGDISNTRPCEMGNEIFTENIDFIARNHRRHFYGDHDY